MSWVMRWLGLPYAKDGRGPDAFDCLGLVLAVHASRGLILPDPLKADPDHRAAAARNPYRRVDADDAQEGDALLFRGLGTGAMHIGFALDARDMLHIGGDGFTVHPPSRVETWRTPAWMRRLEGVYRVCPST